MPDQLLYIHGIGKTDEKAPYEQLARPIDRLVKGAESHFVRWHDLGFTSQRDSLGADAAPFHPPYQELIVREPSRFLFDRVSLLLQVRLRDLTRDHPSWTVQTVVHRKELQLLQILLDYIADVEVYLRDQERRKAIQERLRDKVAEVSDRGPVSVIGHSLGTLVAYDVVHERLPPGAVRNLVTLGSPLENLLYLSRGFGLVGYDLRLDSDLNWLNVYDIKDVIASKLVSGDFARDQRDDWLVRMSLSLKETELVAEAGDQPRSPESFWNQRPRTGLRCNVGINRESTAFEAHADYWRHTLNLSVVSQLIAGLLHHCSGTGC